jgi:uncharacterized protein (TIGR02466 family)
MNSLENNVEIIGIFPQPVYIEQFKRSLSEEENKFIENQKKLTKENVGNFSSIESYVLEKKEMQKLKNDLLLGVNNFINKIICPLNKIEPYITQSWLNWTSKNEFHHGHAHPNSFLSGVFYIDVDEKVDSISFYKGKYDFFKIYNDPKNDNVFNTNMVKLNVKKGMLILFRSHLLHEVSSKLNENVRISLAFNTFIKGTWGSKSELSEITV